MMGERFARMWEFFLAVAELTFLHGPNMVYQLLLSAERDAVPLRRDYIADAEERYRIESVPAEAIGRTSCRQSLANDRHWRQTAVGERTSDVAVQTETGHCRKSAGRRFLTHSGLRSVQLSGQLSPPTNAALSAAKPSAEQLLRATQGSSLANDVHSRQSQS